MKFWINIGVGLRSVGYIFNLIENRFRQTFSRSILIALKWSVVLYLEYEMCINLLQYKPLFGVLEEFLGENALGWSHSPQLDRWEKLSILKMKKHLKKKLTVVVLFHKMRSSLKLQILSILHTELNLLVCIDSRYIVCFWQKLSCFNRMLMNPYVISVLEPLSLEILNLSSFQQKYNFERKFDNSTLLTKFWWAV